MTVTGIKPKLIALGASLKAGGSCSVLAPQPDRSKVFRRSLRTRGWPPLRPRRSPIRSSQSASVRSASPTIFGVCRFVTRVEPNRIELSDDKRWAEPLDKNFIRALSENLATLLNTSRIERYRWPLATDVD
jgi:hypothetical protein